MTKILELDEPLVDLKDYGFILEPAYFNQGISAEKGMFLRKGVAERLARVQTELKKYKIKIWDGYRTRAVQQILFQNFWHGLQTLHLDWTKDRIKREVCLYVADPEDQNHIPNHATGGAVDLTLCNSSGTELDMGTGFDYFGRRSGPAYAKVSDGVKNNRALLREAMLKQKFSQHKNEWWHFDYGNELWAKSLNQPTALYGEVYPQK